MNLLNSNYIVSNLGGDILTDVEMVNFLVNLAKHGFIFSKKSIDKFSKGVKSSAVAQLDEFIEQNKLKSLPLFKDFKSPNFEPDELYDFSSLVFSLKAGFSVQTGDGEIDLGNGLEKHQYTEVELISVEELLELSVEKLTSNIGMTILERELVDFTISLQDDLVPLVELIENSGGILFKENLVYLTEVVPNGKRNTLMPLASTATDVLRCYLKRKSPDAPYTINPYDFKITKITRANRRAIMDRLELIGSIGEDVRRHSSLFLRFFNGIHIGEFTKTHPSTVAVAQNLRNGKVEPSFESKVEKLLFEENKDGEEVFELLKTRPTNFSRMLARLINLKGMELTIEHFEEVVVDVDTRALIQLYNRMSFAESYAMEYTETSQGYSDELYKDDSLSMFVKYVVKNVVANGLANKKDILTSLTDKKVFFEENTKLVAVDIHSKDNKNLYGLPIYSGFPVEGDVVRLFTAWFGEPSSHDDIDLSAYVINSRGKSSRIGWNSRFAKRDDDGIIVKFSGDVQYLDKNGQAIEYIDVDFSDYTSESEDEYVVVNLDSYTNNKLANHDGIVGYMDISKEQSEFDNYDFRKVTTATPIVGATRGAFVLVLDIRDRICYLVNSSRVIMSYDYNVPIQSVLERLEARPKVYDLAKILGVDIVESRGDADIVVHLNKPDKLSENQDSVGIKELSLEF